MPQRDARSIGGLYRTGQVLTTGDMLTVYTAYDSNTNDVVGLSVIETPTNEQLSALPYISQLLAKRQSIRSTHIIKLHNWGVEGRRIYIATDPPRGVTLQHLLDTEDIAIPRALDICKQLAAALVEFHTKGFTGLDLRPMLITVDTIGITDRVQIDDIGLRLLLRSLNYAGSPRQDDIGYLDPRYAPPEYIQSGAIGPWSDIYQVGLLLFTLVTGRLPFTGRTVAETAMLQAASPVPSMGQYIHTLPPELQKIVEHCMEKEPARRFTNADELVTALEKLQKLVQPVGDESTELPGVTFTREMSLTDAGIARHDGHNVEKKRPTFATTNIPTDFGVYAYLTFEKKGDEKQAPELQRIPLMQKSVIVGRTDPKRKVSPDIDLSSFDPDMTVSRLHARISFEGSFFYIEDLKSRNKTRLGALVLAPMKAELLQHEDTVQFGRVRLRFQIPGMGNIASVKKEQTPQ